MDSSQLNLWDKFREGDEKSLEKMYSSHYSMLLKYGYKFTPHLSVIEEAIQSLFIKMWNNRSGLNKPVSLKYYLLKAFRRTLIGNLQAELKISRKIFAFEEPGFQLQPSREETLIRQEEEARQRTHLNKMIITLTNRQKEAIYLRFYEELSYEEIAALLEIELGATYKLIYRAIDRLKEKKDSKDPII